MLRALVVNHTAAGTTLIALSILIMVVVGAFVLAVWLLVARGQAGRDERAFDASAADPTLQRLRQRRLVRQARRGTPRKGAAVVAQLELVDPPAPPRVTRS